MLVLPFVKVVETEPVKLDSLGTTFADIKTRLGNLCLHIDKVEQSFNNICRHKDKGQDNLSSDKVGQSWEQHLQT